VSEVALAAPPKVLSGPPPDLRTEAPSELWRLHWEQDVNYPQPRDPGRWRFDAPHGEFSVTYANVERHHIFVEVYGDTENRREIAPDQAERKISVVRPGRKLRLIDLGDAQTLSRLRLDGRISSSLDYPCTQLWGEALRRWLPAADGIRYPGRKAGREDNLCLFLDRCGSALAWQRIGTIASERKLVTRACQMFDIVPRVYLEAPPKVTWP
jgi:RES domain